MAYRKRSTRDERDLTLRLIEVLVILVMCVLVATVAVPFVMKMTSGEPEARHLLWERFSQILLDDTKEQVLRVLGPPGLICLGTKGIYPHQIRAGRRTWEALERTTVERWIYSLPVEEVRTGRRSSQTNLVQADQSCRPDYSEGEIGFDEQGRVRWYIPLTDESHVVHRKKGRGSGKR